MANSIKTTLKKVKDAAWRVRTIKGNWAPGIIPSLVGVTLFFGALYYLVRDTSDPQEMRARQIRAQAKGVVLKHGNEIEAAQQLSKVTEGPKPQSEFEKSPTIVKRDPVQPTVTADQKINQDAKKKSDDILAALMNSQMYEEGMSEKGAQKNSDKKAEESGASSLMGAISGMVDARTAKKQGRIVTNRSNIPPPAGSSKAESKPKSFAYVNPNAAKEQLANLQAVRRPSGYEIGRFLPVGSLIPVYFMNNVESNSPAGLIELAVAENVIFNHKVQLQFNRRIFATGGQVRRDRMSIGVGIILDHTGAEGRLTGVLMDADGTIGVRGYWNSHLLPKLTPYINTFSATWLAAMQDRKTAGNSSLEESLSASTHDMALKSASRAVTDAGDRLQEYLEQRYEDYLFIPKGTFAYIQLTQSADLTLYERGLSAKSMGTPVTNASDASTGSDDVRKVAIPNEVKNAMQTMLK